MPAAAAAAAGVAAEKLAWIIHNVRRLTHFYSAPSCCHLPLPHNYNTHSSMQVEGLPTTFARYAYSRCNSATPMSSHRVVRFRGSQAAVTRPLIDIYHSAINTHVTHTSILTCDLELQSHGHDLCTCNKSRSSVQKMDWKQTNKQTNTKWLQYATWSMINALALTFQLWPLDLSHFHFRSAALWLLTGFVLNSTLVWSLIPQYDWRRLYGIISSIELSVVY